MILAITHARRACEESRASARPLGPASYRGTRSGLGEPRRSVAQRAVLAYTLPCAPTSTLFLSPRGNKYKSWAYASEVLFGVIRVTALSALLQPLKDRRRFSGREIFQTSFFVLLLHSFFFLASFLSLSLSFSFEARLCSRGEKNSRKELEEGIRGN